METVDRSATGEDNIVQRPNGSSTSTSLSDNGDAIDTAKLLQQNADEMVKRYEHCQMKSHFKAMVPAPNTYTKSMHKYFLKFSQT